MKYERITRKDWKEHMQERRCIASNEALTRLGELEDKIENGTLIELPCKVGDKIYIIAKPFAESKYKIYCRTINRIEIEHKNEIFYYIDSHTLTFQGDYRLMELDYNKTWFTDLKLAQKKLEELNNER